MMTISRMCLSKIQATNRIPKFPIMKTCFICHRLLSLTEFYTHSQMADGHLNKCKDCVKSYSEQRRIEKSRDADWVESELERHRLKTATYRREGRVTNVEALRRAGVAWYARNKHKKKAQTKVSRAIQTGKLHKHPCEVCGEPDSQAHHDDYSKPLDVKWLCVKHHNDLHVELRKEERKKAF